MKKLHNTNLSTHKFAIEERRRQVASLLAKSKTQTEIANKLGVDQSTISDDVKALRIMSQKFIYDLAKSDLGFYYKQCLTGIDEVLKQAWKIHDMYAAEIPSKTYDHQKIRLQALKVVIQAEEAKFNLLTDGPNVLALNSMSERLNKIEQDFQEANK